MVRGDIYLAEIFFTDSTASKVRPILLLKSNSYNDFIFLPLTTNLEVSGIEISNENIVEGYLPKKSIAVFEKIGVISTELLRKKIGCVNVATLQLCINSFVKFIELK